MVIFRRLRRFSSKTYKIYASPSEDSEDSDEILPNLPKICIATQLGKDRPLCDGVGCWAIQWVILAQAAAAAEVERSRHNDSCLEDEAGLNSPIQPTRRSQRSPLQRVLLSKPKNFSWVFGFFCLYFTGKKINSRICDCGETGELLRPNQSGPEVEQMVAKRQKKHLWCYSCIAWCNFDFCPMSTPNV